MGVYLIQYFDEGPEGPELEGQQQAEKQGKAAYTRRRARANIWWAIITSMATRACVPD